MTTRSVGLFALSVAALVAGATAQEPAFDCNTRVNLERVWRHLQEAHDVDGDGCITSREYGRGPELFANYDRDGDGVLTATDFPAGRWLNGFNVMMARMADGDEDGQVTKAEWQAFVEGLDADGDGTIAAAEMKGSLPPEVTARWNIMLLSFDQDLNGRMDRGDMKILFADQDVDGSGVLEKIELKSRGISPTGRPDDPLPKVGELAPDFELPFADDPERVVKLSSFRGDKPVALIFGSYT